VLTSACSTTSAGGGGRVEGPRSTSTYVPEPATAHGSLGDATLSGAVKLRVRAQLEMETLCIPAGQTAPTDARLAIWEYTTEQGKPSAITHWITVGWTTTDVGKTVTLAPDASSDPPRVGVQLADAGASDQQWVSTSGELTILPNGSGGHLKAILSPDHGAGAGVRFSPGNGLVSIDATWKC